MLVLFKDCNPISSNYMIRVICYWFHSIDLTQNHFAKRKEKKKEEKYATIDYSIKQSN